VSRVFTGVVEGTAKALFALLCDDVIAGLVLLKCAYSRASAKERRFAGSDPFCLQ
jgi:hypothetical protein